MFARLRVEHVRISRHGLAVFHPAKELAAPEPFR
jgi:hypothetical protein